MLLAILQASLSQNAAVGFCVRFVRSLSAYYWYICRGLRCSLRVCVGVATN